MFSFKHYCAENSLFYSNNWVKVKKKPNSNFHKSDGGTNFDSSDISAKKFEPDVSTFVEITELKQSDIYEVKLS